MDLSLSDSITVLLVFDKETISQHGRTDFAGYAQEEFLRAFSAIVSVDGGWEADHACLGCEGELESQGIATVGRWVRYKTCPAYLPPAAKELWRSATTGKITYQPYAIAVAPISGVRVNALHELLSEKDGYVALFLPQTTSLASLARMLRLQDGLAVRWPNASGWSVSDDALRSFGLTPSDEALKSLQSEAARLQLAAKEASGRASVELSITRGRQALAIISGWSFIGALVQLLRFDVPQLAVASLAVGLTAAICLGLSGSMPVLAFSLGSVVSLVAVGLRIVALPLYSTPVALLGPVVYLVLMGRLLGSLGAVLTRRRNLKHAPKSNVPPNDVAGTCAPSHEA